MRGFKGAIKVFHHLTVLQDEAVQGLAIQPNGIYVDCTLGGAGHSERIAAQLNDAGLLICFDQDENALKHARLRLEPYLQRVKLIHSNFSQLTDVIHDQLGYNKINGILYDLGVSSPQLDEPERGFSYNHDALLDMRMDQSAELSAMEIVNKWSEEKIAELIFTYGEEKFARRIAKLIATEREKRDISTTTQLVEIIKQAIPAATRRTGPHPAKRTFQALRIAVNDELDVFRRSLEQALPLLADKGRVAVITFHSLEDRICKQTFQQWAQSCTCPSDFPQCVCGRTPLVKIITKKPLEPSEAELAANPRARSAKLRIAEKKEE
jgi:16S rRNA (cytosine1402-N4)-methyltransferase